MLKDGRISELRDNIAKFRASYQEMITLVAKEAPDLLHMLPDSAWLDEEPPPIHLRKAIASERAAKVAEVLRIIQSRWASQSR